MAVSEINRARRRAVLTAREFKWLFMAVPERFKPGLTSWIFRALFTADDGKLHLAGAHALADLREFAAYRGNTLFSTDPLTMARRAGRREVFERIVNYLNLDEAAVQEIMLLDDGLGDQ